MLDSVDVEGAINLGLCSARTVGRTAVYFIRKLLRVRLRLRLRGGKGWSLRLRGAKAGAFAYDCKIDKHTKLYGEVEISCETRYFVYLRRLCPPLNTLILNPWSARTGLLTT